MEYSESRKALPSEYVNNKDNLRRFPVKVRICLYITLSSVMPLSS